MARRWTVNPPMGQVIGGWVGAMIVLGIAGGWLFGPAEVTLHTVPMTPRPSATTTPAGFTEVDAQRAADRGSAEGGRSRGTARQATRATQASQSGGGSEGP
jgi:hypothetical protein